MMRQRIGVLALLSFLLTIQLSQASMLTVKGGLGSGSYGAGQSVAIKADGLTDGRVFVRWLGGRGRIVDVYAPETTVTMPEDDLAITVKNRTKTSSGIADIDGIREEVKALPTTTANAASRRAALYRWWRLLWRLGIDMQSFDEVANDLVINDDNTTRGQLAITRAYAILETIAAQPKFIKEIQGSSVSPQSQTDWSYYMGNDGRQTGYSPDAGPSAGRVAWRFPKGYAWEAEPVIRNGRIYLASPGTDVIGYCLHEDTGEVLWRARQYGRDMYASISLSATPIVSRERILFRKEYGHRAMVVDRSKGKPIVNPDQGEGLDQEVYTHSYHNWHVVLAEACSGKEIWRYRTQGEICGQPVLHEQRIYAAEPSGRIHAFNTRSKKPLWQTDTGMAILNSPSVGRGRIYVQGREQKLSCLSAEDGRMLWTFQVSETQDAALRFFSDVYESEGRAYVGAASGFLYCLDTKDGRLLWKYRLSDWVRSRPLVLGNRVFVATLDGGLYALRASDTDVTELWKTKIGVHGATADLVGSEKGILVSSRDLVLTSVSPRTGRIQWRHGILDGVWMKDRMVVADWVGALQPTPTAVAGALYCGGPDGFMHALDAESGKEKWRFEAGGKIGVAPTVVGDKVFFGQIAGDKTFYALQKDSGKILWKSKDFGLVWVAPVYANGRLFFGNKNGYVFAVDPNTGQTLWRYDTAKDTPKEGWQERKQRGHGFPPGVYSNPVADEKYFYVGSWSGYYFAFDQTTGKMVWRTQTNHGKLTGGLPDSAAPMLHKGHLYVQKTGNSIAALEKETGKIVWEWQAPIGILQNGTVAAHGNRIYGSIVRHVTEIPYRATVLAFQDVESGGQLLWEYHGGCGLTAPVLTDDKLIFGSSADMFATCLDPRNGSVRWRCHTGGQMLENVPALYGNKVYMHCKNGWLFAVE
ncbi:PQQ-binding-like beta-propeller repeat protein [Planctomycetota bacterium]